MKYYSILYGRVFVMDYAGGQTDLHIFIRIWLDTTFSGRTSDGGNRSHNVSLPIILKKTKVGQILQYSCISLLLVPILLYFFFIY